jgi:hypothetical protein
VTERKIDLSQLSERQLKGRIMRAVDKLSELRAEHLRRNDWRRPDDHPALLRTFDANVIAEIPVEIKALDEEDAQRRINEVYDHGGLSGLVDLAFDSVEIEVDNVEEEEAAQ